MGLGFFFIKKILGNLMLVNIMIFLPISSWISITSEEIYKFKRFRKNEKEIKLFVNVFLSSLMMFY